MTEGAEEWLSVVDQSSSAVSKGPCAQQTIVDENAGRQLSEESG